MLIVAQTPEIMLAIFFLKFCKNVTTLDATFGQIITKKLKCQTAIVKQ